MGYSSESIYGANKTSTIYINPSPNEWLLQKFTWKSFQLQFESLNRHRFASEKRRFFNARPSDHKIPFWVECFSIDSAGAKWNLHHNHSNNKNLFHLMGYLHMRGKKWTRCDGARCIAPIKYVARSLTNK